MMHLPLMGTIKSGAQAPQGERFMGKWACAIPMLYAKGYALFAPKIIDEDKDPAPKSLRRWRLITMMPPCKTMWLRDAHSAVTVRLYLRVFKKVRKWVVGFIA